MHVLRRSAFGLIIMLGLAPQGAAGQQNDILIYDRPLTGAELRASCAMAAIDTAISMVDLTTLEGADTAGKVRSLCAKARRISSRNVVESHWPCEKPTTANCSGSSCWQCSSNSAGSGSVLTTRSTAMPRFPGWIWSQPGGLYSP